MKTTQGWGWLVAGVLALGLNGFYHDGGAVWAHRVVNQVAAGVGERTEGVLALAAGRADWFVAKAERAAAHDETASCRLATALARVQTKVARTQAGFAGFEAISAREEAQWHEWRPSERGLRRGWPGCILRRRRLMREGFLWFVRGCGLIFRA